MTGTKIGERIRKYREELGMSPADLAERSGCGEDVLQAVEAGEMVPALGSMVRIARALGVRLGTFMDDEQGDEPYVVRKGDYGSDATLGSRGLASPAQDYQSLGAGKLDRHMEPFFIELGPCEEESPDLSSHEGEEFILVAKGKVRVIFGPDSVVLSEGDTIYYNSVVPHHVSSADESPARIYAVLFSPA